MLLITYYFKPFKGVGALRPTYWAEHMNEADSSIVLDVITAQKDVETRDLAGGGLVITVENKRKRYKALRSFDIGLSWYFDLKEYFLKANRKYDVVICTGGPFLHFFICKTLKDKFNSRTILDFRDPFANNPNHTLGIIKKIIKKVVERSLTKSADKIIVVNEVCRDLLECSDTSKVHIIDNGYDESVVERYKKTSGEKVQTIIYPGKIYPFVSVKNFINVLSKDEFSASVKFQYVGQNTEIFNEYNGVSNVFVSESEPYKNVIKRIASADIGLIITGGKIFESTTKVFDYIGFEKKILIITNGKIKTGIIHKITERYPNVYWSKNDQNEISLVLKKVIATKATPFEKKGDFSRKAGLKRLLKIIHEKN